VTNAVAFGIDVGGTNVRVAAVDATGKVLDQVRAATPVGDADGLIAEVVAAIERLAATTPGARNAPVGMGVAGLVGGGVFRYGPNVGLADVDLSAMLGRALAGSPGMLAALDWSVGRVVPLGNDATLAALAEWQVGAAAGHDHAVVVTVGTGVGGGLVIDGRLVAGSHGFAGEIGHVTVVDGGRACSCGNLGCLEAYVSGTGVAATAAARLSHGSSSALLSGLSVVTGRDVQAAADAGDVMAREILEDAGRLLGVALAGVVNLVDPDVVVLGGGAFVGSAEHLLSPARAALASNIFGSPRRRPPEVLPAALGDDAGVVGAALLALDPWLLPGS